MTVLGLDSAQLRKARGAFFTPDVVAGYLAEWAVRSPADAVLEPSCGEAVFLLAVGRRLRQLGADGRLVGQLHGAELHAASAKRALALLNEADLEAEISVGDFLKADPHPRYDAVVGNPPYVRYQSFSGESRAAAKQAAMRAGVALTNLASSWAAFTVHSALHVKRGGRLGLVLPAEMLSVNYAAPVREFLMRQFKRVRLVLFTERVFPGVMEDVVLLLAEGCGLGPSSHCELLQTRNGESLAHLAETDVRRWDPAGTDRWSGALLNSAATGIFAAARESAHFVDLQEWGDTTLGMVTGNNAFFALTADEVRQRQLVDHDVVRLSPPGSRHLRGLSLTTADLARFDASDAQTWLFRPDGEPSGAARRYIREGQTRGVDTAYKCRVRTPWWRVPYQKPADLLLTYMNADTARLCTNATQAHHLNSVHGVYLGPQHRRLGRELLSLAALNAVTLLGAELVGRSYGGGVLKLEPREADSWPMPSPALVEGQRPQLRRIRRRVRDLLVAGRLLDASALVDEALLARTGLTEGDVGALRAGRQALHDRRVARSRSR
ncbi:MAG: N-6 DNA methylase [Dermatophilaceae bacterium]